MATAAPWLDKEPAGEAAGPGCRARPATARVLHLVNGEHYAGAERVQDLLALRLPAFGFEVGFACLKRGRFARLRQAREAPLYELAMRSRLDVLTARAVARLIRGGSYTLLHSHTPRALVVGRLAAALAGVGVVHHVHSPTAADTTHRLRNWVNATTERISLARIAAVVAVSQSMGRYARGLGIPPGRISVVPNGVPVRGPLPPRWPPAGEWTLGAVALFRPRKGLEVLLAALAEVRSQGWPARLRAVGSFETPGYEAEIRRRAQQLGLAGVINWRGFTTDVNRELDEMDLFVLPSLFGEGLPMVVLEAMAAGVPVVGTRVEGVPEAIRDGVDGLITTPGDSRDLARALLRFFRGDLAWNALRSSAHQRQAGRFSDRSMADGVARVYREVLAR